MKLIKALLLSTLLVFAANAAFATNDDVIGDDDGGDDVIAFVPEPTAALVMGAGLATIAVARRFRRRQEHSILITRQV